MEAKRIDLSPSQTRILLAELDHPDTRAYHLYAMIKYAPTDHEWVKKAIPYAFSGNLSLRISKGGEEGYYLCPSQEPVEYTEIEAHDGDVEGLMSDMKNKGVSPLFDSPLYRIYLIHTEKELILFSVLHHLIADGTTVQVILPGLMDKYIKALKEGMEVEKPAVTYDRYIERVKEYAASDEARDDRDYWISKLSGYKGIGYKTDRLDKGVTELTVPDDIREKLNDICAPDRISPFVQGLGPAFLYFAALRNRLGSKAPDMVWEISVHGRYFGDDLKEEPGMFVATLPLRLEYDGRRSFLESMCYLKAEMKEALSHAKTDTNDYLGELKKSGVDLRSLTSFSAVSNSVPEGAGDMYFPDATDVPFHIRVNQNCRDAGGLQRLTIEYNSTLFKADDIDEIKAGILRLLKQAAEAPDKALFEYDLSDSRLIKTECIMEGELAAADEPVYLQSGMNRDDKEGNDGAALVINDSDMTDTSLTTAALIDTLVRFGMTKEILIGLKSGDAVLPFGMKVDTSLTTDEYVKLVSDKLRVTCDICDYRTDYRTDLDFAPSVLLSLDEPSPIGNGVLISICVSDAGTRICYDSSMYSAEYMKALHESMKKLYREMTSGKALKDIPLVSDEGSSHAITLKNEGSVNAMFERLAAETPDKVILTGTDRTMTCRELDEEANRLGDALIKRGIKQGDRVLILMKRTCDLITGLFGVLKAGAVFITLDPGYPAERISQVVEDSGAALILTDIDTVAGSMEGSVMFKSLMAQGDAVRPDVALTPQSMCFIIYTSGTTGRPKGVVLSHGGITNYVEAAPENAPMYALKEKCSKMLCLSSVSFIVFLREIFGTILNGVPVVLCDEEQNVDPLAIASLINKEHIDAMGSTPTRLLQYLEVPDFAAALAGIRLMIVGGEGFPGRLYDEIRKHSGCEIYNSYGPTEVTIASHQKRMESSRVSAGFPMLNVWDRIADPDGNELPPYAAGELYVGGAGVAIGYFGNKELTDERFPVIDGERYCNTGDLAYKDDKGEVFVLGRNDGMIKLRGLRIELEEVENVIGSCEGIVHARVVVRNVNGAEHLCAFYTTKSGADPVSAKELRNYVAGKLPGYMVPSYYTELKQFPMTPNGKVAMKVLKELDIDLGERVSYEAPRNDDERCLFGILADVLGTDNFGIYDDFFTLGLTSLTVISVMTRISAQFKDVSLSISDISANPNIAGLAGLIAAGKGDEAFEIREDYPLTQTQKGVLTECLLDPSSVRYNIAWLYRLSDRIDTGRLKKALEAAVDAHPYLKATLYVADNGEYRVKRNDTAAPVVTSEENGAARPEPFTLTGEPLYRIKIINSNGGNSLFLEFHHLIFDGSSERIFLEDVNAAYEGRELMPEDYTGFEAALLEEKLKESDRYDEAKKYYDAMLSDIDQDMLPQRDVYDKEESTGRFSFDAGLSIEEVHKFCEKHGITENAFYNSAFAYALACFTGQENAYYTTVYNGRNDVRIIRAISMFVKTFPVVCRIDHGQDVETFMRNMQEQLKNSMANDIYSFAEIAHAYEVPADLMFIYHGEGYSSGTLGGEPAEAVSLTKSDAKAPINIGVIYRDGHVIFDLEYRSDMYSKEFLESMASCLSCTAGEMMHKERLCDIKLLTKEAEAELDELNDTEVDYDKTATVLSLLNSSVRKHSDRTAIVFGDIRISYERLGDLAERIAAYIADRGIVKGSVVSVMIPRCEYMPIASYGVLMAGCAYQPLDPSYPDERLNFMVEDAGASLLITTKELVSRLSGFKGEVLFIEDISALPVPDKLPEAEVTPDDLFILLYTSGSTGVPKGVKLTHGNIVSFAMWCIRYYSLTEECNVGAYASYGFDMHMMDTYPTLIAGATEVIVDEDSRLNMAVMNEYMEKNHVTHMFMTTQVGRQFAINVENRTLKALTVAGEKLVTLDPPAYPMYNGYGPTECTCLISISELKEKERDIPIGVPLDNVRLYVVGAGKQRLPKGAVGELWAAGPHVGAGYLNRPEKTAEVFVDNPFGEGEYKRCYRTGDIVRYRTDGRIEYIGRRDGQVKIRGFRIELSEVEAVVREYPGIKDATVAAFDNPSGGKYVAAYIVSDEKPDTGAIEAFIRERKPPYMVPAVFVPLDAIPLNQNGKVNRRMLPVPQLNEVQEEAPGRKLDELDLELLKMVKEAIGVEVTSFETPLIRLGMTSITSIMLSYQLSKRFGLNVPVKELLSRASLTSIKSSLLTGWMNGNMGTGQDKVRNSQTITEAPLSYAQMGVYYECMKRPAEVLYNIPNLYTFSSETDEDKLVESVRSIIKAHPVLSSHFEVRDGAVIQQYDEYPEEAVEVVRIEESGLEAYKSEFVRPFDLRTGPLYRFAVARTEEHLYLLADIHHLVFDGFSMGLFMKELAALLKGEKIKPESYPFYEYISDERRFEETEAYEDNRRYYADMLCDYEKSTVIEPDKGGDALEGMVGRTMVPFDYQQISDFCAGKSVTPASLLLAATSIAISAFTGEDHIYITTISTGRGDIRISDTYGMFVNTLPLSIEIGTGTADEFTRRCFDILTGAMEHEKYPFARIAADYGYEAGIFYEYQIGMGGSELACEPIGLEVPKSRLRIAIEKKNDQAYVVLHYNDALYTEELMQSLGRTVVYVAGQLTASPDMPLDKIEFCDREGLAVLDAFNEEAIHPYDDTQTVVSMFRRAVSDNKDRPAVIFKDRVYTYAETDDITDRIAAFLNENGVGKGNVVSVMIPRCEYMALASLGVPKAGAAYQPLDTSYPSDRLNYMVKDSSANMLITTKELRHLLTGYDGNVLYIEDIPSLKKPAGKPVNDISPDDLFILLYTSGSTGTPKGVRLTHRNLVCFINWFYRYYNLIPSDRIGAYASYGFDVNMEDTYTALTKGASLCIIPEEIRLDLNALNDYVEGHGITHLHMTTQIGRLYALNIDNHTIKHLTVGGEKLADYTPGSDYAFHNTYGPTECTISLTFYPVIKYEDNIPIGKALDNMRLYVIDKAGRRLPIGALGELLAAGPQVADGYMNLPEKSAEVFVKNPFGSGMAYHTGDIVRYRQDGNIEFFGRRDGQVKIRGFRIELTEVETVIRSFPGVKDAAVTAWDHASGQGKFLAAYVEGDDKIDLKALKLFVAERKPPYMVPESIMQIDRIPLNQNLKVNRRMLPYPVMEAEAKEAAANEAEKIFCEVFSKVLNVEDVGATDDFFMLGGTSILVTLILVEAEKRGYKITYQDVFDLKTPRRLAEKYGSGDIKPETHAEYDEVTDYDYDSLKDVLSGNNLESFKAGMRTLPGDILLTGAIGYLGIHVLHELLVNHEGRVYCLLRGKKNITAARRLKMMLEYYFSDTFDELWDERIFVVEGDITGKIPDVPVDTVINCAAVVKHFSAGTEIEDVNTGGVRNLVDYCVANGLRLIQVSTMSTVSMFVNEGSNYDEKVMNIDERDLYFGQNLNLKYTRSKFLAERIILEAVSKRGLDAKIMRVGNLAARYSDGEFQINYESNSFMGTLRIYAMLGVCPYEQLDKPVEFSPIDDVARAILLLAGSPKECVVFHAYNPKSIVYEDVFEGMKALGLKVKPVEKEEFMEALHKAEEDPVKAKLLISMIAYGNWDKKGFTIPRHNSYTTQVLHRMDFGWHEITGEYVKKLVGNIKGLGYFDLKGEKDD